MSVSINAAVSDFLSSSDIHSTFIDDDELSQAFNDELAAYVTSVSLDLQLSEYLKVVSADSITGSSSSISFELTDPDDIYSSLALFDSNDDAITADVGLLGSLVLVVR